MEISAKIIIFRPTWVQLKEASLVKMGSINKFILITWQLVHYWDTEKASPRVTTGNDGMRGSPGISPWSHNNLNSYSSTKDVLLNIQTHLRDPILKHVKLGESEPVGEEGKEESGKGCWVVTTARQSYGAWLPPLILPELAAGPRRSCGSEYGDTEHIICNAENWSDRGNFFLSSKSILWLIPVKGIELQW